MKLVTSDTHSPESRHPQVGRPRFIWGAPRYADTLVKLADHPDSGIVAIPLKDHVRDKKTAQAAIDGGLGIAFRGQAWINQLPSGHVSRSKSFDALSYAIPDGALDIGSRLSDTFVEDLAGRYIDAQIGAGGTLIITPAHYVTKDAINGLDNELRMVQASIAEFATRQGRLPATTQATHRSLYAAAIVSATHLADAAERLIPAYSAFDVDGFWIDVEGFDDSSEPHMRGLARMVFGLQTAAQKPVVVAGVGSAHFAFLTSGLAGASVGHHAQRIKYPPPTIPPAERRRNRGGIGIHIFHRGVLANLRLDAKGKQQARSLFKRVPCHCGEHDATIPPSNQKQTKGHNLLSTLDELGRIGLEGGVELSEAKFATRVERAAHHRQAVQIAKDVRPWLVVAEVARELRDTGDWRQAVSVSAK